MRMTGQPEWMLYKGWGGLGGVQVRTACCTEAARAVSRDVLRMCKVHPTATPELKSLEEGFSCGRVPHG